MYKNYLIDYSIKNIKNHPLSACKWNSIILNSTNNNLILQQKDIFNILLSIITICGQFPKLKKAKKNISVFNVRKQITIGTITHLSKIKFNLFLNKFIFSILPNIKTWQIIKYNSLKQNYFSFNIGFENLSFWYELKNMNSTGIHLNFKIKQIAKSKDFLYFLSKNNLQLK